MSEFLNKILHNKRANLLSVLVLIFVSLLIIFPIGALHSSSVVENTSEYLADVAENHTTNGKYAAMMVEPNDETDKKINNPYYEFHYLYGIFREGLATYAGSVNADKNHSIKLKEIDDDINFSFLNVDSGFGVKEYYVDDDGNMIYKQEFYPLELMFYSNHPILPGSFSFFYISQRRADSILEKRGLPHSTREDYSKLLNTLTTVEFDGVQYQYTIDNIYLEQNYFYEALNEVMGEFFLGGHRYPNSIKRQGIFFLRNYAYQNKYYIQYSTGLYPLKDFDYQILDHNFKENFTIDDSKLVYASKINLDVLVVFLIIFAITLLIAAAALILFGRFEFSILNHICIACAVFVPYLLFWIIYAITKSTIIFSNFSTTYEMWCVVAFIAIYLIIMLFKKQKKEKEMLWNLSSPCLKAI